jgi:hypothetical protein
MMKRWTTGLALAALSATQMGGCGGGGGGGGVLPSFATVVVVNNPDTFTVSVSGFDYDGTVDRAWSCSTSQAELTIASSLTAGSVRVRLYDHVNALVYDNTHDSIGGLGVTSRTGTAGTWRVIMDFDDVTLAGALVLEADTLGSPDAITLSSAFGSNDLYTFHAAWGAVSADVSVGGVSVGSLDVSIWHGGQDPQSDAPFYTATVGTGGLNATTPAGQAGTWTIRLDFSGAAVASALSITSN